MKNVRHFSSFCCFIGIFNLLLLLGCGEPESPVIAPADIPFPEVPSDAVARAEFYRQQLANGERSIPRTWYETKDPALLSEYFRAQLIKQFGERKEVHILADMKFKMQSKIYVTRDEMIDYLEAKYTLFPNEHTLKTLERYRREKAAGILFVMVYSEPGTTPEQTIQKLLERRAALEEAEEDKEEEDPDA